MNLDAFNVMSRVYVRLPANAAFTHILVDAIDPEASNESVLHLSNTIDFTIEH
jgi:hypothetical protein